MMHPATRRPGASLRIALSLAAGLLASCGGEAAEDPPAVIVQPDTASVSPGASAQFFATVRGLIDTGVAWDVVEASAGTITPLGLYTAPSTTGTFHVRATSRVAPSVHGTATVNVAAAGTGLCGADAGQLFPPTAPWNTPIDAAPLDAESSTIISYLQANHTGSTRFQTVFDFHTLYADASVAHRAFTPRAGSFYSPHCDTAPIPVPRGGAMEGLTDYRCRDASGNFVDWDCHITVIDRDECRLYEAWQADISTGVFDTGTFVSGCLAIWDIAVAPPPTGRGDSCTSADAAGLPILPLVFTPDEIAAGEIKHAIRFILPNNLIRDNTYVRPGTHCPGATSGPASAPPYAVRVRLKAGKDISGLSPAAQVVARALKKYGMILADGGNYTFTAASDLFTTRKWAEVGFNRSSMTGLAWTDFEVVELGTRFRMGDCTRTPITR